MKRYIVPSPSPAQVHLRHIPKGYPGTMRTVAHVQELIRQGAKDFYVRQKAIDILLENGIRPKDYLGEIKSLFEWVQQNVRYTKDPFRVEVLHTARRLLELRAGDCDDMAILLGTMLEAIGHPIRLVIVGPDPSHPRFFSHIYLEVHHKGRWIPLDATMSFPMGWAPRMFVKMVIPMNGRHEKMSEDSSLHTSPGAIQATDWIHSLIQAVGGQAIAPRDPRVKNLIRLLRRRQLWGRSRWLRRFLQRTWQRGRAARTRTRAARQMTHLLRLWKVVPAGGSLPPEQRGRKAHRPLQHVALRPLRGVTVRPVARPGRKGLGGCG